MLYLHPETYLRIIEQDREREMAQRAFERAAREGGEQRPGLVRGGINNFAALLRQAGAALTNLRPGGSRPAEA